MAGLVAVFGLASGCSWFSRDARTALDFTPADARAGAILHFDRLVRSEGGRAALERTRPDGADGRDEGMAARLRACGLKFRTLQWVAWMQGPSSGPAVPDWQHWHQASAWLANSTMALSVRGGGVGDISLLRCALPDDAEQHWRRESSSAGLERWSYGPRSAAQGAGSGREGADTRPRLQVYFPGADTVVMSSPAWADAVASTLENRSPSAKGSSFATLLDDRVDSWLVAALGPEHIPDLAGSGMAKLAAMALGEPDDPPVRHLRLEVAERNAEITAAARLQFRDAPAASTMHSLSRLFLKRQLSAVAEEHGMGPWAQSLQTRLEQKTVHFELSLATDKALELL